MFQDWQTVAVWLIILVALLYVGRRGWDRARSFRAGGKDQAACDSGCGSCSGAERTTATMTKPQNALVQITDTGRAHRQRHQP